MTLLMFSEKKTLLALKHLTSHDVGCSKFWQIYWSNNCIMCVNKLLAY